MRNKDMPGYCIKRSFRFLRNDLLIFLLAFSTIISCMPPYKGGVESMSQYTVGHGSDTLADGNLQQLISGYRDSLSQSMLQTLAYSKTAMTKELPEGNLGNYCADACFRITARICREQGLPLADFLFLNNGGLRASLPAGKITTGHVFELMPFENELVMIRLSRSETDSLLQVIASKGGAPVSGFRMKIVSGKADVFTLNDSSKEKEEFIVITSDYLAAGNDGYTFLKTKIPFRFNLKVRDALIADLQEYGRKNDTLNISKDGRITKL